MRKFFAALLTLIIMVGIALCIYFKPHFAMRQFNKLRSFYYVYEGDKAYEDSDMLNAIKMYNHAVLLYPGHYSAWYNLGNIYVEYEDYPSAAFAYMQAFTYNPKLMIARMNYGIVQSERLGNFDDAISQYDEITKTNRFLITIPYIYDNKISTVQNVATAYYNKGVAYKYKALFNQKNNELNKIYMSKAIDAYQKSIKMDPTSFEAQYNLGIAYFDMGRYEDAGRAYCRAIRLSPMSYEPHYNMAVLLRKMGYHQDSYDEMEKAMSILAINSTNETVLIQEYVASIFNIIAVEYYGRPEEAKREEQLIREHKIEQYQKAYNERNKGKKAKDREKALQFFIQPIAFIHGSDVTDEDLDKAVIENYANCPEEIYFTN